MKTTDLFKDPIRATKRDVRWIRLLIIGLVCLCMTASIALFRIEDQLKAKYDTKLSEELATQVKSYESRIDLMSSNYEHLHQEYENALKENESLQTYYEEIISNFIAEDARSLETVRKFKYLFNELPTGTTITLSDIIMVDDLCKQMDVNPHVVWAIVKGESAFQPGADAVSGSGARGLGQFLKSTGRFAYEDLMSMGKGTYNHNYAYNPTINLKMVCYYLNYELDTQGGSLSKALSIYSGGMEGCYSSIVSRGRFWGVDTSSGTYR